MFLVYDSLTLKMPATCARLANPMGPWQMTAEAAQNQGLGALRIGRDVTTSPELFALSAYFMEPRSFLWPRRIPVTILATQDDVSLIPYTGSKALKSFTYAELRSAAVHSFLGRHTVILHASDGAQAVQSRARPDDIAAFCQFINRRIVTAVKKPLGARFKLTQLEAPPDSIFSPSSFDRTEYDSAMDVLFDPADWPDLLLDDLNKNIEVVSDGVEAPTKAPIVYLPPSPGAVRHPRKMTATGNMAGRGAVSASDSRHSARTWALAIAVLVGFPAGIWWLDGLPAMGIRPFPAMEKSEKKRPTPQPAPDSRLISGALDLRETERLVSIMHDDARYAQLIEIFKEHRASRKLGADEVSVLLGWSSSDLSKVESAEKRLDILGLINLAIVTQVDIHEAIERVK